MEMPHSSVAELQIELKRAEERNDVLLIELREFLEAISAKNLTDALERHRRFAQAAIDLPKQVQYHEDMARAAENRANRAIEQQGRLNTELAAARVSNGNLKAVNDQLENTLRGVTATIKECIETFDSPMLAHFTRDLKQVVAMCHASARALEKFDTNTETDDDA
jgi:response regulator RpfG family c-di-GMP phosphodiesterase